jgi:hypothetical protein
MDRETTKAFWEKFDDELPNFPDKGWFIGIGRPDMLDGGVERQLVTAKADEHKRRRRPCSI